MPKALDSEHAWFEQELSDLYAREARYREQLGKQWASSARLREHMRSLHELLRRSPPTRRELSSTLVDVARLSASALKVQRTSVWLFDAARSELSCAVELRDFTRVETTLAPLSSQDCPRYIEALRSETALAVSDARNDPRSHELEAYLREFDVHALLDIPIAIPGDLLGVVCHEHLGGPREWTPDEVDFASNVGALIALTLETERRAVAELAARGMEAKYRYLVESLPVTVYSFDYRTNRLDYVSPQGLELGEFASFDEVLGGRVMAWIERVHPDDRERIAARLAQGGVSGGLPAEVTYRLCLPSGKTRWVRDIGRVVRRADGRPISVQGILCDITEQKQAEASRQEFARRYQTLLESVDMVAVTLDREGRATFVNDAFVRLSGYSREQLIGADWFERVIPASERERVRGRYLADIERASVVPRFELEIETQAGKRRQLLCANTMLRNAEGAIEGSASLALDISERRALDEALLQQTKLESLGRLAAGVAHDFNNLLNVMLGQTSLLKSGVGRDDERSYEAMEQALDQATELTASLLAYGRQKPRKREPVPIDVLIEETRRLLSAMIAKRFTLTLSLQSPEARVRADRSELRQLLINLVANAADAMENRFGSVRISSHVELLNDADARERGLATGGEFVVLSVSDDGPGIEPAIMKHIFEPFFTTKGEGRGTGLGLAIAHSVVSAAQGTIDVQSELGHGSVFRIHLPLASEVAPNAQVNGTRAVLVVEGDDTTRAAICKPLRAAGYDVYQAPDVKSATRLLSSAPPGLLIANAALADGSGLALAKSVRTLHPNTPVVMIARPEEVDEGFAGQLSTPVDETRLLSLVRDALRAKAG